MRKIRWLIAKIFVLFWLIFAPATAQSSDAKNLLEAEKAQWSGHLEEASEKISSVQTPELAFWKSVLQAEIALKQGQSAKVLSFLSDFEKNPNPQASLTEDGYSWLYKRALETLIAAKTQQQKPANFETSQLVALYPQDESIQATLAETTPLSPAQKIHKLKQLSLFYKFKPVKGLITTEEILASSVSETEKCEAFVAHGRALKGFPEEITQAIESLKAALKSHHCSDDHKAKALFYLGNIGKNSKIPSLMQESYENLAKNYSSHYLADDALYELGFYHQKSGNNELAQKYFGKLDALKTGDMRVMYFFDQGFDHYKRKNYERAIKFFEKATETTTPINETYVQSLYWQARATENLGNAKKSQSKNLYQKIVSDYPFSFYAVLAAKQIGASPTVPDLPALGGDTPSFAKGKFDLVDEFNQLGFSQGARVMIDLALIENEDLKKNHAEFLAKKFIESENYREAIEIAAAHFTSGAYGPVAKTRDPLITAFYPKVFKNEVEKGYRLSELPLGAIEGIAREESLFKKDATSLVGAKGLMQLMPTTARMIQGEVSAHTPTTELTHPLNNILLGSHYLKLMRQKFSDQMPLAIMAYNAGPGNVLKWLKQAAKNPNLQQLDMFIEEIPFNETKGYVKRVMRSMNIYGAIYNEDYFLKNRFSLSIKNSTDV